MFINTSRSLIKKQMNIKFLLLTLSLALSSFVVVWSWINAWEIPGWSRRILHSETSYRTEKRHLSIYFLETSGKPKLTLREACSVESAALHNPKLIVQVLSTAPFRVNEIGYMQTLSRMVNVKLRVMRVSEVLENTSLSSWYESGQHRNSKFPAYHLSDAIRLAILWKFGGMYLDLDTITLRSLGQLTNALGLQGQEDVANGIMAFEKNSPFLSSCMAQFAETYRPDEWGFNGPVLVTKELKRACNVTLLENIINLPEKCQGIRLLPMRSFLPVGWQDWKNILQDNTTKYDLTGSYMVHLYGALSHSTKTRPRTGTLLDNLAQENCPETYEWMLINNEL